MGERIKKPTLEELEEILDGGGDFSVEIMPNGEVIKHDLVKRDNWISVKDRLPIKGDSVLIFAFNTNHEENKEVYAGRYQAGFAGFTILGYSGLDATHWQPLPEQPKDK